MQHAILEQKKDKTGQIATTVLITAYLLRKLKEEERYNTYYRREDTFESTDSYTMPQKSNPYQTFYGRNGQVQYFDPSMLHGWVNLEVPTEWNINPFDYGDEANDTNIHEASGHLAYRTGHEGFVRSLSRYLRALGRTTNRYILSVRS